MKPISKMISPLALVTVVSAFALATPLLDRHPDGSVTAYRGWGPTKVSQDGYACTLYGPNGNRVGSFFSGFTNGKADLYLSGKEAHFLLDPGGFFSLQDLDEATFPNLAEVPAEYKTAGHSMMTFEGRSEAGVNLHVAEPVTNFAKSVLSVEYRCVYIVDESGVPVFCMNCVFVIAQSDG